MILGAVEGQIVVVALMALFGFINWISSKLNTGKQPPATPSRPQPPSNAAATPEEERMRHFFEALGLPPDTAPVAPRPRAAPPILPRVAPAPLPPKPKARPLPAPPPLPAIESSWAEDETLPPAPERLILPELAIPAIREYETVAARISAVPAQPRPQERPAVQTSEIQETLLRALSTPQGLRTAFVLREILGPPPGLQR